MDDEFPAELAMALATRVAKRGLFKFGAFRDHSEEDLVAIGAAAIFEAWSSGKFDPDKGATLTTFLYRAAWCDVQDLYLRLTCRRKHEIDAVRDAEGDIADNSDAPDAGDDDALTFDGTESLCDWLRINYVRLSAIWGVKKPTKRHRGRPTSLSAAQRAALAMLQERMKLSSRGVVFLLATRPDLRDAIRLNALPHYTYFHRLKRSVAKIGRLRRTLNLPACAPPIVPLPPPLIEPAPDVPPPANNSAECPSPLPPPAPSSASSPETRATRACTPTPTLTAPSRRWRTTSSASLAARSVPTASRPRLLRRL